LAFDQYINLLPFPFESLKLLLQTSMQASETVTHAEAGCIRTWDSVTEEARQLLLLLLLLPGPAGVGSAAGKRTRHFSHMCTT
jgi:hypothetical protein